MKFYSEEGQCFADMENSLTMRDVELFYKEISSLLQPNHEFVIHCVDLVEIDSAGIQILISLKKTLEHEEKLFELTVGKKLKEMIALYRLEEYFKGAVV